MGFMSGAPGRKCVELEGRAATSRLSEKHSLWLRIPQESGGFIGDGESKSL